MADWLGLWEAYCMPEDEIPFNGFVALVDGYPAAMAFIRKVEGGFGQLDGLVTNPLLAPEARSAAIDDLVAHIIAAAKDMKLKALMSFSRDKNTLVRAERFGFSPMAHTLIALGLRKDCV